MKKTICRLFFPILLLFLSFTFSVNTVLAQEDRVVLSEISIDYDENGNILPSILKDGYKYSVSLYADYDTEFQNCLMDNLQYGKIVFPGVGTYLLKYDLENISDGTKSVETAVLRLLDVQAPQLFLQGAYPDDLVKGDSVEILSASVYDNSGENLTATYKVFFKDADITDKVKDGKIELDGGEYSIIYYATDSAGNQGELITKIIVKGEEEKGGCSSSIGYGCHLIFAGLCLAVCCVKIKRSLKNEK